jgi:hypothetical protein
MNNIEIIELLCSAIGFVVMALHETNQLGIEKETVHDSALSGAAFTEELLKGHRVRFYNNMGMDKDMFRTLCCHLREAGLEDSRHVTIEEQLAIFIRVVRKANGIRDVCDRFQHSGDTISR